MPGFRAAMNLPRVNLAGNAFVSSPELTGGDATKKPEGLRDLPIRWADWDWREGVDGPWRATNGVRAPMISGTAPGFSAR